MQLDSPVILGNPSEGLTDLGNVSGTATIDLTQTSVQSLTVTGAVTISVSSDTSTRGALVRVINGGSAAVTWNSTIKWAGGTAPSLTAAGVDFVSLFTLDGVTFYGSLALKDVK